MTAFETARLSVGHPTALGIERPALTSAVMAIMTPATTEHLRIETYGAYDEARAREWIDANDAAMLFAIERSTGSVVGFAIVAPADDAADADDGAVHLGYVFAEAAWGRGLATELVTGLVAALGRPIGAGVSADHAASIRVLERAGFVRVSSTTDGGLQYRYLPG